MQISREEANTEISRRRHKLPQILLAAYPYGHDFSIDTNYKDRILLRGSKKENCTTRPAVVTTKKEPDLDWVNQLLLKLISDENLDFDFGALKTKVMELIRSSKSSEELQTDLLDLLGFSDTSLELSERLLAERDDIKKSSSTTSLNFQVKNKSKHRSITELLEDTINSEVSQTKTSIGKNKKLVDFTSIKADDGYKAPVYGSNVGSRAAGLNEEVMKHTFLTGPLTQIKQTKEKNTKNLSIVEYSQVVVSPSRKFPQKHVLVQIREFEKEFSPVFKGIKTLNTIQSVVFPVAYKAKNNLLVCAPTVRSNSSRDEKQELIINRKKVKIIYIAPMKALVNEIVTKFSKRLSCLELKVRELTGDMSLTKKEMDEANLIVTTPEKWDVITRKVTPSTGSDATGSLSSVVKLVIIDEIHLLGEDRGYVLESIISRTMQNITRNQIPVRIVGLSATLPNYLEVGTLIKANPVEGIFYFGPEYRPVPLTQTFVGIDNMKTQASALCASGSGKNVGAIQSQLRKTLLNELAWKSALEVVETGNQVLIFVHSRKDTSGTVRAFFDLNKESLSDAGSKFLNTQNLLSATARNKFSGRVKQSKNDNLREFFEHGFGIHHAGMLRTDRNLSEELFEKKAISVLVCTATLAWGVNLPAHCVIIKGTEVYTPDKPQSINGYTNISMQDVLQCFGRAGRPGFDDHGKAILISEKTEMRQYLKRLTNQIPLESNLVQHLPDILNAEIVSGFVSNVREAVEWLGYTFLFVRMMKNPLAYGITTRERQNDPTFIEQRVRLIINAAAALDDARMVQFVHRMRSLMGNTLGGFLSDKDEVMNASFGVKHLGRTGSIFYIDYRTIELFDKGLKSTLSEGEILSLLFQATEFKNIQVREDEISELRFLKRKLPLPIEEGFDSPIGKCILLFQSFILRKELKTFTLVSDRNLISQNTPRILAALLDIAINKQVGAVVHYLLAFSVAIKQRVFYPPYSHCLYQFVPRHLKYEVLQSLLNHPEYQNIGTLVDESVDTLAEKLGSNLYAEKIKQAVNLIPYCHLKSKIRPLAQNCLKVTLSLRPEFTWRKEIHGGVQVFHIFIEESLQNSAHMHIYHKFFLSYDNYVFLKQNKFYQSSTEHCINISFYVRVPGFSGRQLLVNVVNDAFFGSDILVHHNLDELVTVRDFNVSHSQLNLLPLPVTVFPEFEALYGSDTTEHFFDLVQTSLFHELYYTTENKAILIPSGRVFLFVSHLGYNNTLLRDLCIASTLRKGLDVLLVVNSPSQKTITLSHSYKESLGSLDYSVKLISQGSPELKSPTLYISSVQDFTLRTGFIESIAKKCGVLILNDVTALQMASGPSIEHLLMSLIPKTIKAENLTRLILFGRGISNMDDFGTWIAPPKINSLRNSRASAVLHIQRSDRSKLTPIELEREKVRAKYRQRIGTPVFKAGCVESTQRDHITFHGFPERNLQARLDEMNKPVFHLLSSENRSGLSVIFVNDSGESQRTAVAISSLLATSLNPFLFFQADKDASIFSDLVETPKLKSVMNFGIGFVSDALSKSDIATIKNLVSEDALRVVVLPINMINVFETLTSELTIVKGLEYKSTLLKKNNLYTFREISLFLGYTGKQKNVHFFCKHSRVGYFEMIVDGKFPVESNLIKELDEFIFRRLKIEGKISKSSILEGLQYSFLRVRLKSNLSYYVDSTETTDLDADDFLATAVEQSLLKLEKLSIVRKDADGIFTSTEIGQTVKSRIETVGEVLSILQRLALAYPSLIDIFVGKTAKKVVNNPVQEIMEETLLGLCGILEIGFQGYRIKLWRPIDESDFMNSSLLPEKTTFQTSAKIGREGVLAFNNRLTKFLVSTSKIDLIDYLASKNIGVKCTEGILSKMTNFPRILMELELFEKDVVVKLSFAPSPIRKLPREKNKNIMFTLFCVHGNRIIDSFCVKFKGKREEKRFIFNAEKVTSTRKVEAFLISTTNLGLDLHQFLELS
eukprot:augustus_masked-scaffold_1-processed-gene-26.4-mRNA-1 protein AED:0.13 eAED:0.14 QI:0/0/0/0.66/1/1/3/0/1967